MEATESTEIDRPELVHKDLTRFLVFFTLVACLGSAYCGFNLWLVNDPVTLKDYFGNISTNLEGVSKQEPGMYPALFVFTVIAFLLGCLCGSLVFATLADKYGRRKVMLVNDVVGIVSTIFLVVSKSFQSKVTYAFARFFTGLSTGLFSCAIPMYLGEISPKDLRGGITVMHVTFVSVGIMFCQGLSAPDILGNPEGSPYLCSIPGVIASSQFILMYFCPESPRYLLIQRADEEGARQALQKFRNNDDVEDEIKEFREENSYEQKEKRMTIIKLLRSPRQRWQLLCVIALFATQQFSGVYAAYYYSAKVLDFLRVSDRASEYVMTAATFLLLFIQSFSICKIDSLGRRPLLLIGVGICIICCVLLTMSLELQSTVRAMAYVSCFLLLIFTAGNLIGPNSIPHLMITELFLQSSRASAFAIGGFVHWFFIFFIGFTYVLLEQHLRSYSFLMYLPFCIAGFVYSLKFVPETRKKTFLEIRKLLEIFLSKKYVTEPPVVQKQAKRVDRRK